MSLAVNLGLLGLFKYYNFFITSFTETLAYWGYKWDAWTLKIILPIGISFYTFHGISYVIDIYKDRIKAEKNWINYALFVSFFPLLVAGPIERATHLLPQIKKKRVFSYEKTVDGLRQILWGLFKKVVIADQCAKYVNIIFNTSADYAGSTYLLGAFLFSFQIYGDFSGYSDIALGTARLLGIDLLKNFNFPYFSRDIAEFWRRWHISLSSWFKDYLYLPLGGSRGGMIKTIRNTLIIFLVSGFWHGANWTFIIWGLLNAVFIMPSIMLKTNRQNLDIVAKGRRFPTIKDGLSIGMTFGLTTFMWLFFRAENLTYALHYVTKICSPSVFTLPIFPTIRLLPPTIALIVAFIIIEWRGREQPYALADLGLKRPRSIRWTLYCLMIFAIFLFSGTEQQFIYFQF